MGVVCETERLMVFADHRPIREGHVQIVPRAHFDVFDELPPDLAAEIVHLGQRLARALKRLYPVERVGFVFTGNEVAHVHAHVLPLFAADDITSARFVPLEAQHVRAARLAEALDHG
jgi:histidine triad (HIT) family protein